MPEPVDDRRSYRVRLIESQEEWTAWIGAVPTELGENPHFARVRHIDATGETVLWIDGPGFTWVCPGCGMACGGSFGSQPVSGWDQPRWVLSGPPGTPTLTPSLGCPTWRRGDCVGHWFLRDGLLVRA